MKKTAIIAILICWNVGFSQIVRSKIDTTRIQIGERITLTLEATVEKNDKVLFPQIKDTLGNTLEIISQKITKSVDKTKNTFTQTIVFTSFEKGEHGLEPMVIRIADNEYVTNSYTIQVEEPNLPDDAKMHPIKDIYKDPKSVLEQLLTPFVLLIAGIVLFLALFIVIVFYVLKSKRKHKNKPIHLPIDVVARKKIDDLYAKELMQKGEVKKHYSELVSILKEYIGKRYAFSTEELLSSDIMLFIQNKKWMTTKDVNHLQTLFNAADLAKFAKSKPSLHASEEHKILAQELIEDTKPMIAIQEINGSQAHNSPNLVRR